MELAVSRWMIEAHGDALWATPNQSCGSMFQSIIGVAERNGGDDGS